MDYADRIQNELQTLGKVPPPTAVAINHSEALDKHLRSIAVNTYNSLSFDEFMQEALYAPALGYYSAGSEKIGASGDFITAPEISPLFSDCLAHQIEQVLQHTGGSIIELGAGRGIMAADILRRLEEMSCLPESYYILEISAELQQRQQQTLAEEVPHLMDKISWLKAVPEKFTGVIVANEVLDAMPVKLFKKQALNFRSQRVAVTADGWQWQTSKEEDHQLQSFGEQLEKSLGYSLEDGYESEVNFMQLGLLRSLSDCLQQGLMLFIDYGFPQSEYYHPQRQGTLM